MASPNTIRIPVEHLTVARKTTIALVGNPNSGKSTVFNRLTGLRQKTANFPGVTVEKRIGQLTLNGAVMDLVDLPGTYSLSANSDDERIAVEVLLGRVTGTPAPDVILAAVDATRLYQSLYLLQQLAELGRPMVIALTMTDAATRKTFASIRKRFRNDWVTSRSARSLRRRDAGWAGLESSSNRP